jgi:hypothetical protein
MDNAQSKSNRSGRGFQDIASALQPSGLLELNDTEHLGVTDHSESQPQQYTGREKQSAKGSRRYFKVEAFAIVRLFHGNTSLLPGNIGAHSSDAFAVQLGSRAQSKAAMARLAQVRVSAGTLTPPDGARR